jgi:hypothetical protein
MSRTGNADTLGVPIVCNRNAILTPSPSRSPTLPLRRRRGHRYENLICRAGGNSTCELFFVGQREQATMLSRDRHNRTVGPRKCDACRRHFCCHQLERGRRHVLSRRAALDKDYTMQSPTKRELVLGRLSRKKQFNHAGKECPSRVNRYTAPATRPAPKSAFALNNGHSPQERLRQLCANNGSP